MKLISMLLMSSTHLPPSSFSVYMYCMHIFIYCATLFELYPTSPFFFCLSLPSVVSFTLCHLICLIYPLLSHLPSVVSFILCCHISSVSFCCFIFLIASQSHFFFYFYPLVSFICFACLPLFFSHFSFLNFHKRSQHYIACIHTHTHTHNH